MEVQMRHAGAVAAAFCLSLAATAIVATPAAAATAPGPCPQGETGIDASCTAAEAIGTVDEVEGDARTIYDAFEQRYATLAGAALDDVSDRFALLHDDAGTGQDAPAEDAGSPLLLGLGTLYEGTLGLPKPDAFDMHRPEQMMTGLVPSVPTVGLSSYDITDTYRVPVQADEPVRIRFVGYARCELELPGATGDVSCAGGTAERVTGIPLHPSDAGTRTVVPERSGYLEITVWDVAYNGLHYQTPAQPYGLVVEPDVHADRPASAAPPSDAAAGTTPSSTAPGKTDVDGTRAVEDAIRTADGSGPRGTAPSIPVWVVAASAVAAFAWVLYRRLTAEEVLENDLRVRILEILEDEPGVNATALVERLDVAMTTVLYHTRIPEDAGHVTTKRSGGGVRFFASDQAGTILEREVICALRQDSKRALVELVRDEPGIIIAEAARRLDRNRSTIKRHVDDLLERGVIEAVRDGRSKRLRLPDAVRERIGG